MKKSSLALILIILGGLMFNSCGTFGSRPEGSYLDNILKSPHYNSEKKSFVNRRPKTEMKKDNEEMGFGFVFEWFAGVKDSEPKSALPEVKPNLKDFLEPSKELKVIWFGHSTFLLNMSGKIVLVDPIFSGAASPFSFMVKRFQRPVLDLNELPEVDTIVISHDHYDHLDMESIKFFVDKKTKFVTPLGVGSHLRKWGVQPERISELDWWEKKELGGVSFIATPAQHFSGRGVFDADQTLWASWVIQNKDHNIYFSGDSGYDTHFKTIGDKYGPFDLAFIENGQYNDKWKDVHMMPDQAAQAYFDLRAKKYFPIHWGMFKLSMHTWYDPIVEISNIADMRDINLVSPKLGEIISITDDLKTDRWWTALLNLE